MTQIEEINALLSALKANVTAKQMLIEALITENRELKEKIEKMEVMNNGTNYNN